MKEEHFIQIGKVGRPHGLNGTLKFAVDERYAADFLDVETIFLEQKGRKVPFFIEDIREGNAWLVQLEDVCTPEAAQVLSGCPVFMREADLLPEAAREQSADDQYERYVGFTVLDTYVGEIEKIEEIIALPQHFVGVVLREGKEVLIPMHPSFIKKADASTRTLLMELPEGILEL